MKSYQSLLTGLAIAALFFAAGALDAGFFSVGQAFVTCLAAAVVLCWSSLRRPVRRKQPVRSRRPAAAKAGFRPALAPRSRGSAA